MKYALLILLIPFVFAIPQLNDFVTDDAGILTPEEENSIFLLAKEVEQKTSVEIAIVTVNSLEGLNIEQYAVEIFEKNGIGKEDVDNGLLILIVPSERKYRIEVGYGLEGVLPDIKAREIGVNTLEPYFKNEKYGEGIYEAIKVIKGYIEQDESVISEYQSRYEVREESSGWKWIYFIILVLIILSFFRKRKGFFFFPVFFPTTRGGFSGGTGGFGSSGFGGFGGGLSGGGGFSGGW